MTDTIKHTRGPRAFGEWSYDERYDSSCGHPCTQDGCPDNHPSGVFDIDGPDVGDWPDDTCMTTNEADARLIAAAPDMLEALETVLNSDMAMREEDEGEVSDILNMIRETITKATGEKHD